MGGGAVVVQQAGDRELAAARPPADRLLGLEHGDREPLPRERGCAGEPVGPRADDEGDVVP